MAASYPRKRKLAICVPPIVGVAAEGKEAALTPSIRSEPITTRAPLTLSAYRRPEEAVRVADSDTSRVLSDYYDLDTPECGILGHGAMSTVRLAVRKSDGCKVAVKCVEKHHALRSRRLRRRRRSHLDEWDVLRRMKGHPNVVSLLDVFETDDEIQLVMEYCRGGELFDAVQRKIEGTCLSQQDAFTEDQGAVIARQMLSVLSKLHSYRIVHRDVKPENILLTSEDGTSLQTKLCDFGVARVLEEDMAYQSDSCSTCSSDGEFSPVAPTRKRAFSTLGSDFYTAPELLYGGGYSTAVDIYSLGVSLFIVLCGSPPSLDALEKDGSDLFADAHWENISKDCKDCLKRMLDPEPSSRISAEEALQSKWIEDPKQAEASPKAKSPSRIFSPSKPRPVVDLELVRTRLYSQLERIASGDEELDDVMVATATEATGSPRKRTRTMDSGSSMADAVVDLYRDVAASATAAASIYSDRNDTISVMSEDGLMESDDEGGAQRPPTTFVSCT
uniref:Protein kinase domain-containing protein n=1 Tax=Grammatophora oceanica TaxID=210454 RepID=A0A7S1YKL8_9STRA|mmetsp:Transcript_5895/g.8366  ORF Transcript_5895/g.8366 Transcript_5895/m.8366 type:complete len:503 (+) Transcript_5895:431-1939(+)|eukprot:CAMPEP_0194030444 /NCGR_PEP_ID=MMETSP0009_2-20130614/3926_1 /TAXON_ID=210454 /ORGANISM="Grammatophora oceanica, Strain CCMP 410" /LENGTH=502 /DNA_ID=CAMNT_0038670391 /DNA_START=424 /DNA_END=1932 /DNA_ORIENTATION=-